MKKSFITNLILVATLIVLAGWYFIYEKKIKVENKQALDDEKKLVALEIDSIQYLKIQRPDQSGKEKPEIIHLKKTGENWNLESPVEAKAEKAAIRTTLNALTTASYERIIEENPKDLSIYGLDKDYITVEVQKDSRSPKVILLLGKKTPVDYSSYVKKDNTVYKVPQTLKASFSKPLKDFRNKNIFDWKRGTLSEVEIAKGAVEFRLKKSTKGDSWSLAKQNIPAEKTTVDKLLNNLVGLSAKDFASEKATGLVRFGLHKPAFTLNLTQQNNPTRLQLIFGNKKDKWYVRRGDSPTIFEIAPTSATKIHTTPKAYYDYALAKLNRFKINKIKLTQKNEDLVLVKMDDKWVMEKAPREYLNSENVDKWVALLQDTNIESFLNSKNQNMGLSTPSYQVTFWEKDQPKEILTLSFGKTSFNRVFGERTGLSAPFQILKEDFKAVSVGKKYFTEKPAAKKPGDGKSNSKKTSKSGKKSSEKKSE